MVKLKWRETSNSRRCFWHRIGDWGEKYNCAPTVMNFQMESSGSEGDKGVMAPGPVKISHKKMAAKSARIDFMFLGPSPTWPLDALLRWMTNLNNIEVCEKPVQRTKKIHQCAVKFRRLEASERISSFRQNLVKKIAPPIRISWIRC